MDPLRRATRRRSRWILVPAAAAALAGAACATTARPGPLRVISSADLTARPAGDLRWIGSYEAALATVLDIMARDLDMPRLSVSLFMIPDRAAFEATLLQIGYDPALAGDAASSMTAIGGFRAVLMNEEKLRGQQWPDRVRIVAHELAHSLQYELGGGHRGASEQWLREGFADWVSLRVLDKLLLGVLDEARARTRQRIGGAVRREALPRLDEMVTFRQWVALSRRPAGEVQYDLAFAAADLLIHRHGAAAVLRYFARFATSDDREGNFRASFGETLGEFASRLDRHLR